MYILKATWELTGSCNAKCPHCYASDIAGISNLPKSCSRKLIQKLYNGGIRFLTFSGGEPCLADNLGVCLSEAHSLGMTCTLITNGTIDQPDVIEAFRQGSLRVVVSILAGNATDFERIYKLSIHNFEKQQRFLASLPRFSVNIALFSANASSTHINSIASYLIRFANQITDISVFPASPLGRGASNGTVLAKKDVTFAGRVLSGKLAKRGIHCDFSEDCLIQSRCPLAESDLPGQIFINPQGRIRPCHGLIGYESKYSLNEMSLHDILSTEIQSTWRGDPKFIFDFRCKAVLLNMGFPLSYVKQSGGRDWLSMLNPKVPDDVIIEHRSHSHIAYRPSVGEHIELNDDALEIFESCRKNRCEQFLATLDDEEIGNSIEVLNMLFNVGFLEMSWSFRPEYLDATK